MEQQLEILVLSGVSAGDVFRFAFTDGRKITIGRAEQCDVVLSDPRVSRQHATIRLENGRLLLADLGSSGGTVHMGFQLSAGEDEARLLAPGDEFKIGDMLFRANFEPVAAPAGQNEDEQPQRGQSHSAKLTADRLPSALRRRPVQIGLAASALLLLLLLFLPSEDEPSLPKQYSNSPLDLPEYRLLGYWPGSKKSPKTNKDSRHLDMVQFNLPTSNVLIEYEYIGQSDIQVRIDKAVLETLPAYSEGWRDRQIIVRDVLQGKARRLIFDNLAYPGKKAGKRYKRWGVRNTRATPLIRDSENTPEQALTSALALTSDVDKTPDGLFQLIRAMQLSVLELMIELKLDAAPVPIIMASAAAEEEALDVSNLTATIETILAERRGEVAPDQAKLHLDALVSATGRLEAELWRRVNSRIRQAKYSAKAKNHIVVYDNLAGIKAMFPDESDYRWVEANDMLNDSKMVPKRLLESPSKYRR